MLLPFHVFTINNAQRPYRNLKYRANYMSPQRWPVQLRTFIIIVDNNAYRILNKKKAVGRWLFVHCYCFHHNHSNTHSNSFRPLRNEEILLHNIHRWRWHNFHGQKPSVWFYLNNGVLFYAEFIVCGWNEYARVRVRVRRIRWLRFHEIVLGLKGLQPLGRFGRIDFSARYTRTWTKRACREFLRTVFRSSDICSKFFLFDFIFGDQFIYWKLVVYNELMSLLSSTRN